MSLLARYRASWAGFLVLMILGVVMALSSPTAANDAWMIIGPALILVIYAARLRCPQCAHRVARGRFSWHGVAPRVCTKCGFDLSETAS